MPEHFMNQFALTPDELQLLLFFQDELLQQDAKYPPNQPELQAQKRQWREQWQQHLNTQHPVAGTSWFEKPADYAERLQQFTAPQNHLQSGIVLLELIAFVPYVPLEAPPKPAWKPFDALKGISQQLEQAPQHLKNAAQQLEQAPQHLKNMAEQVPEQLKHTPEHLRNATQQFTQQFKKLQRHEESWTVKLKDIAEQLGYSREDVSRLQKSLNRTRDEVTKRWERLGLLAAGGLAMGTIGFGVAGPLIATAIGNAAGLYGAAAITYGMAAIGSLVGGGMSAGTVVLVGGGALLGLSSGTAFGTVINALSLQQITAEAIKLEVVLKEIILQQQDIQVAFEMLAQQRETITSYQTEIDRLRLQGDAHSQQIAELEKAVTLLEAALKRNQEMVSKHT